jgi:hypothetical protein
MTPIQYVVLAYTLGLGLLLGYSARLWLLSIRLAREQADAKASSAERSS